MLSITLSDGLPIEVRQLGLFELDNQGREIIPPYRYTMLSATGQFIEDEYVFPQTREDIPKKPDKAETPEELDQLRDYETYLAALAHEKLRMESYEGYAGDIAAYILANCIIEPNRIVTIEDWQAIYKAALVPQLTEEGLADCLANTFQGYIQGYANS